MGALVCVASPSAITQQTNVINRQYVSRNGDTFYTISSGFSFLCDAASIAPGNIAAVNGYPLGTMFLAGVVIQVPCAPKAGINDCGCGDSIAVCGSDSVQYNSYCYSLCNYGQPSVTQPCSTTGGKLPSNQSGVLPVSYCVQGRYCYGRAGLAPSAGGPSGCTCPYAQWSVTNNETMLILGTTGQCAQCLYANSTCNNMCMQCKQARTCIFSTCWGNCMSCSRIPCGGPKATLNGVTYNCVSTNMQCI